MCDTHIASGWYTEGKTRIWIWDSSGDQSLMLHTKKYFHRRLTVSSIQESGCTFSSVIVLSFPSSWIPFSVKCWSYVGTLNELIICRGKKEKDCVRICQISFSCVTIFKVLLFPTETFNCFSVVFSQTLISFWSADCLSRRLRLKLRASSSTGRMLLVFPLLLLPSLLLLLFLFLSSRESDIIVKEVEDEVCEFCWVLEGEKQIEV